MERITLTYRRRPTSITSVGGLTIGSEVPVRIQSMGNTDTNDIVASAAQAQRIFEAGGEIVRFTTQGSREAESLREVRRLLNQQGQHGPLVADVHFNANVADLAAQYVEKVRINPGNYVDPARKFEHIDYTDEEYAAELKRLANRFTQLLNICKEHHTAIRIGVNHGSLSDRIMSRYGDTPAGMVESCMEFLRVAVAEHFEDIVLSIKASNTRIMVDTVRLLVAEMAKENMQFPLHLGVTEAGEGEDGRIKSAVGIGALLADGIGDTIRVSLSEAPEAEIPVARALVDYFEKQDSPRYAQTEVEAGEEGVVLRSTELCDWPTLQLHAAAECGRLLWAYGTKSLRIEHSNYSPEALDRLAKDILQAAGLIRYKTEYVSCPSCGRTLFQIEEVIQEIRKATGHLSDLKIAVMGCIVNGPGEMADADYGYVGAARGKISLYRQKELVEKNIPQDEAVEHLIDLIKADGRWQEK